MSRGLDHLQQLHEMCSEEMQQLEYNLAKYRTSSEKMLHILQAHWLEIKENSSAIALIAYDSFLTSVSNIMDAMRKLNIHLRVNNLEENASSVALFEALQMHVPKEQKCSNNRLEEAKGLTCNGSITSQGEEEAELNEQCNDLSILEDEESNVDRLAASIADVSMRSNTYQNSIPPIEENDDSCVSETLDLEFNKRIYHYTERDLEPYYRNKLIKAKVVYVRDAKALQFYLWDTECQELSILLELRCMLNLRQYTGWPPENEVFGLVLDETILRAVRENSSDLETRRALLLDFGEVVELKATDIMYRLTPEQQHTPAQAILCQLDGIVGRADIDLEQMQARLLPLEYELCTFRVESVEGRMLHVSLQEADKTVAKQDYSIPANANTNPFLTSLEPFVDAMPSPPQLDDITLWSDDAIPLQALPREHELKATDIPKGISRDDWEMLQEETLCTSNAMKAVLGYDPKDDQRICRHYDPSTGGCFKGTNCRQEHTFRQADGWTKDVLPAATIVDNRLPQIRYAKGLVINITPTYVGQLERFYAQINNPKEPNSPLIWNPEDIKPAMRLQRVPLTFELVLARYEDGLWYRAKVMEADDAAKIFKVFYVDYGNSQHVPLRDLAQCDAATLRLPFQAVLCRLANVSDATKTPEERKRGVNLLCKLILNQTFDVKVLGHHEDLLVRFVEERFVDVPATLMRMGYMKRYQLAGT